MTGTKIAPEVREENLRIASDNYYNGTPSMDDATFDGEWRYHEEARREDPNHPVWKDTILDRVGAPTKGKVKHPTKMYSLDNIFVESREDYDKVLDWVCKMPMECRMSKISIGLKIDGVSLNIVYKDNIPVSATTRGDGEQGEDVTDVVFSSALIPPGPMPMLRNCEVRGEVFIRPKRLPSINRKRVEAGKEPYANPRNAAAGMLMQKGGDLFSTEGLEFVVHGIIMDGKPCENEEFYELLYEAGWNTLEADETIYEVGVDKYSEILDLMTSRMESGHYAPPHDGIVIKLLDASARDTLGYTSRAPKWAVAIKLKQPSAETTLKAIKIQVSRNGIMTPVAELEPVELDGSVISSATLHNEDFINKLGVRVGDTVKLQKAGAIIPEIIESVTYNEEKSKGMERQYWSLEDELNGACPECSGRLTIRSTPRKDGKVSRVARCTNTSGCKIQLTNMLIHAFGRDQLNINLGTAACGAIAATRSVRHPFEVLHWDYCQFKDLSWVTESGGNMTLGAKRAAKVMVSIGAARKLPFHRWIYALGIPNVGKNTSKDIVKHAKKPFELLQLCLDPSGIFWQIGCFPEEAEDIRKENNMSSRLGPTTIHSILEYMEDNSWVVHQLIPDEVTTPEEVVTEGKYTGKKFAITGTLSQPRTEIAKIIESHGGTVSSTLTKTCDYLVAGEKAGSKLQKAEKMGVKILTEEQL